MTMSEASSNHFQNVPQQIAKAPREQRVDACISNIATQMQGSADHNVRQFGEELQSARSAIVRAVQQT